MAPRPIAVLCTLPLALLLFVPLARADRDVLNTKLIRDSRAEAADLWRQGWTVPDSALDVRLQGLVDRLTLDRARDTAIVLRVHVFRSPVANAFCLPDGSMYVFVGLLAQVDDWNELSFILAHEAEHALAWHGQRRMERTKSNLKLFGVLSMAVGSADLASLIGQLGLALTEAAMINGYGRQLESEADAAAAASMERQGLPPCAGANSLRALLVDQGKESKKGNFFWGDHPLLRERIASISATVPGGCPADSLAVPEDYAPVRDSMARFAARLWLDGGDLPEALGGLRRCLARDSTRAGDHAMLGEVLTRIAMRKAGRDTMGRADTLALAERGLRRALELDPAAPAPWRWLGGVAEARRDTSAAIDCLQRYLAGGANVPNRRIVKRKLDDLRASGSPRPVPTAVDSAGAPGEVPRDPHR